MQQWDFEIVHRKGALHHVPDALSRMFEDEVDSALAFEEITDEEYIKLREEVKKLPKKYPSWKVENGVLYRNREDPILNPVLTRAEGWRMAVPKEYRERVMHDAHCTPSSGHLGVEKTYERVAREYYWKGIYHDVLNYVKSCKTCQEYKVSQQGSQGLMGKRIVERPWAVVAADLMEFPPSKSQHKYLVVFQDLFTRWIEVKPLRKADGKSVARAFEELILFRWETPDYLLTDNGKEFINKHLQETLREYGVKHITTPPYHPQANPVERSNRTLKTMIAAFVGNDHRNWDAHVHEFRHAANTAVQSSTKVSPAFLNYGRHPRPVKSLRREIEGTRVIEKLEPKIWEDRMRRLDAIRDLVSKHIDRARAKQEKQFNKGKLNVLFNVGDLVMRRTQYLSDGAKKFSAKLAPKYEGPYEIVEIRSPTVVILGEGEGSNRRIAKSHISALKRYIPPRKVRTLDTNACKIFRSMEPNPEEPRRNDESPNADSPPPAHQTWRQKREEIAERRWERREESKIDRAQRAELKRQRQERHANLMERRTAERLAQDAAVMFTAAEALTIEPPTDAAEQSPEPDAAHAEREEPSTSRAEEPCADVVTEESNNDAIAPAESAMMEEAPSSPMLADSEIAAEGEYPTSPIPVEIEHEEELPPTSPAPIESAEAAAPKEVEDDPLAKLSWADQMDLADKEEEERQKQLESLRKDALKTMPRWARGEGAERDPAVTGFPQPIIEPPHLPPTLFKPVAARVTLVAEALSRPIFVLPGEGEQTRAWYQPHHPLIVKAEDRFKTGEIPRFLRQPRTIYRREPASVVELPAVEPEKPAEVPMEVDEPAPILPSVLEVPVIEREEASAIEEEPAAAAAPKEPLKEGETTRESEDTSVSRRAPEIRQQREVTPLPVLPIDTAPIAATPTRWDDPAPSKYAAMNLAPYSRIQEHQEYAALHPSKGAIKKARKDRENPNPRRNLVKDDYVPRHLSSPPPQNWRRNAVDPVQRTEPFRWTEPAPMRAAPIAPTSSRSFNWPAPAPGWESRDVAPQGNWRAPPPSSSPDLRQWLDTRGARNEMRIENPRREIPGRSTLREENGRDLAGGSRTADTGFKGVCRTVSGGTMYHNVRAIVTDPRVDPPPFTCYNCWEPGHPFTKCPRPQTQHYCRNCGRRHVEVQECPRCSQAHREHLEQQQKQYQEYLMRVGQEEMRRRRAELFAASPWNLERRESRDIAGPSTSGRQDRATSEPADRQRTSRKRTRDDSPHDRRSKRLSREPSVASTSSRRDEPRVLGARHETFRILEETRAMADQVREGLMRSIVQEFLDKEEDRRRRRR